MFLKFGITDIITVPFGYLLDWLYQFTRNYGLALIAFAVVVKLILIPATAKSKKSMMKMSRLTPRINLIREKYENDPQKQNELINALYKEEGVSMGGGCLWSLLPLLLLLPLYAVVRQPITYMLHETKETAELIVKAVQEAMPALFTKSNTYYSQMVAAPHLRELAQSIKDAVPAVKEATLNGINFSFLGINLGEVPSWKIWAWGTYDWAHFGAFLMPVLSAAIQVLSVFVSQKMNDSVVTDSRGLQDKETAQKSQAAQTSKTMLWISPIMSLWIGFSIPGALSLYWFIQGVVTMIADVILTKKYRTIYDAEDAQRLAKALEEERLEMEREKIRAQRRAENPDGITENTSKKKLQQKAQREQEQARAAAAREYAAMKGIAAPEDDTPKPLSGIEDRPFCKGRAYDPDRYQNTEEN